MARISIIGLVYQIAYLIQRHYVFGWSLIRWLSIVLVGIPLLGALNALPLGQAGTIVTGLIGVGILFGLWRIKRRGYLRFKRSGDAEEIPVPQALPFPNKVDMRVSGNFSVGGMNRYYVDSPAQYQAFETRERVIMVNIIRTRFLLFSLSSGGEVGWWYTFFKPEYIREVECGTLYFGLHPRPVIKLTYQPEEAQTSEIIYLSFGSSEAKSEILADLLMDKAIKTV